MQIADAHGQRVIAPASAEPMDWAEAWAATGPRGAGSRRGPLQTPRDNPDDTQNRHPESGRKEAADTGSTVHAWPKGRNSPSGSCRSAELAAARWGEHRGRPKLHQRFGAPRCPSRFVRVSSSRKGRTCTLLPNFADYIHGLSTSRPWPPTSRIRPEAATLHPGTLKHTAPLHLPKHTVSTST